MNGRAWNSTLRPGKPLGRRTRLQPGTGLARTAGLTTRVPLERGTPIRPVSTRRAAENRVRAAVLAPLRAEPVLCSVWQARLIIGLPPLDVCTRWGDDANEILRRSQGGSITDLANINTPCRPCHDVLTFTPRSELAWARDLGLIRHSWPEDGDGDEAA